MTREKLFNLWEKEIGNSYSPITLTVTQQQYIEGKMNVLPDSALVAKKHYLSYPSWLVKELDGEQADTAKRMLRVLSQLRAGGIIRNGYCLDETELKVCYRIGYSFEEIKNNLLDASNLRCKDLDIYVAYALEYAPKEAIAFAIATMKRLKIDDIHFSEIREDRNCYFYAFFIGMEFARRDMKKYSYFANLLFDAADFFSNPYICYLLHRYYDLTPSLHYIMQLFLNNNVDMVETSKFVYPIQLDHLEKIGVRKWSYYYTNIVSLQPKLDRIQFGKDLRQLLQDDRKTFFETYYQLIRYGHTHYAVLLWVMMRAEGIEIPQDPKLDEEWDFALETSPRERHQYHPLDVTAFVREACTGLMKCMINDDSGKFPKHIIPERVFDPQKSEELWEEWRTRDLSYHFDNIRRRIHPHTLRTLAVLYDYLPEAKWMTDHFMLRDMKGDSWKKYTAVVEFVEEREQWLGISKRDSLLTLIEAPTSLGWKEGFEACLYNYIAYRGSDMGMLKAEDVLQNEEAAYSLMMDTGLGQDNLKAWFQYLVHTCRSRNFPLLVGLLKSKSKITRKLVCKFLATQEEGAGAVLEKAMQKMKGDALLAARNLVKLWNNRRKFGETYHFTNESMVEFCELNYEPEKARYMAWIPVEELEGVHTKDRTTVVPPIVLKYVLSEYLSQEEPYRLAVCDKVVDRLDAGDVQAVLENIYQEWLAGGADTKRKLFMVPYCIYASDTQLLKIKTQLQEWAQASRGALAAFVINGIALNGGSVALMMVDAISAKFPSNQVKKAAKAAFAFAAKALEVPEEVLSDRIVPTLGFSAQGERVFDYGGRTFTVSLQNDSSLMVFDDAKQKAVKSLPAPGAHDEEVKAAAAKKEFAELKKQIKATLQTQSQRLGRVLTNGRCWKMEAWKRLFVENPVMHPFAFSLIWGVYEADRLVGTFRYMEDGTFNTVDEEEYELPEGARISLVHPVELEKEVMEQWKEQLEDYEVTQVIPQLDLPTALPKEEEISGLELTRYVGTDTTVGKLSGLAKKHNLERGDVLDAGSYCAYHYVDRFLNMAAMLNFGHCFMGQGFDERVELGSVVFYRLDAENPCTEDEPKENRMVSPKEVEPRFLCSIIGLLDGLKEA